MSRDDLQPAQAALIARAEARWLDQARLRLRRGLRPRPVPAERAR